MKFALNISAIIRKMKKKPGTNDMYKFMQGANVLTLQQIENIENIVDEEIKAFKAFLNQQKQRLK